MNNKTIVDMCWYVFLCAVVTILVVYLRNISHKEIVPLVEPAVVELKLPEPTKHNKVKYVYVQTTTTKCEAPAEVKTEVKLDPVHKPVKPLSPFDADLLEFERKL